MKIYKIVLFKRHQTIRFIYTFRSLMIYQISLRACCNDNYYFKIHENAMLRNVILTVLADLDLIMLNISSLFASFSIVKIKQMPNVPGIRHNIMFFSMAFGNRLNRTNDTNIHDNIQDLVWKF